MNTITEYIGLAGLVIMPVLINANQITAIRERNGNVSAMISIALFGHVLFGVVLMPMLPESFLKGNLADRVLYYIYVGSNFLVQLFLIHKRAEKNPCTFCIKLKRAWIIGVIIYTVLLGKCGYSYDSVCIALGAGVYVIYNTCALGAEYFFNEQPVKMQEEWNDTITPLKRIDSDSYRIWLKSRELKRRRGNLLSASVFLLACIAFFVLSVVQKITLLIVLFMVTVYVMGIGSLVILWNIKIKEIESRPMENVYIGKAFIETASPFRVRYMDSEGEFQSRVVEKVQRKKYKQGTLVDIVMENGEVVLAERNLPE